MTLEWTSVPLALAAGGLGVVSPCVWPLVPVVMSSAARGGPLGPWMLSAGLALSFALSGTLLSFLLVSSGLDPEIFRHVSGVLLIALGLALVWRVLGDRVSRILARLPARTALPDARSPEPAGTHERTWTALGWDQLGVGALLGLVWLPCVGPTLGAAIGLASMGQSLGLAFATMLAYGLGTAAVLMAAGLVSHRVWLRWRPGLLAHASRGRRLLGFTLMLLGTLVVSGLDKRLEALAVSVVPEWALRL